MALTGAILLFNYWTRHDPLEFFIHCIVWPWNPPLSQFTSTRRYSRCMSAWDGSCNVEERHSWLYSKYRTRDCDKMLWQNTNVVGEYLNIILCAFVFVRSRTRRVALWMQETDTHSWRGQGYVLVNESITLETRTELLARVDGAIKKLFAHNCIFAFVYHFQKPTR